MDFVLGFPYFCCVRQLWSLVGCSVCGVFRNALTEAFRPHAHTALQQLSLSCMRAWQLATAAKTSSLRQIFQTLSACILIHGCRPIFDLSQSSILMLVLGDLSSNFDADKYQTRNGPIFRCERGHIEKTPLLYPKWDSGLSAGGCSRNHK
jgi:hypothetical protein